MGRKHMICNEELIKLIEEFYFMDCQGDSRLLKIPAIGNYVRAHGYPEVKDYIIRRNLAANELIQKLKANQESQNEILISSYKTLDVEKFLDENYNPSLIRKSLTALDNYYKHVSEAASSIIAKYEQQNEKIAQLEQTINELKKKTQNCDEIIKEKKKLAKENHALRQVVNTYVYPEIANELLEKQGILKYSNHIVDPKKLDEHLIKADSKIEIKNNLIQGMFNYFDEEEH